MHTGFYRVLQDVVEVCGVERSNEIRRRGREYNNKLSQVRAARRALAEKATGEGVIWKNAEDLVSGLSHVVYDRDGNFGLYHSMLSMRMSYNPRVRLLLLRDHGAHRAQRLRAAGARLLLQQPPVL